MAVENSVAHILSGGILSLKGGSGAQVTDHARYREAELQKVRSKYDHLERKLMALAQEKEALQAQFTATIAQLAFANAQSASSVRDLAETRCQLSSTKVEWRIGHFRIKLPEYAEGEPMVDVFGPDNKLLRSEPAFSLDEAGSIAIRLVAELDKEGL